MCPARKMQRYKLFFEIDYAPNDMKLQSAEENARKNKLGLWSFAEPIPPWEFRKNQKIKKNDSKIIDNLFDYTKLILEKVLR